MPGTAAGCSRSSGIISARSCNRNCYRSSGTNYARLMFYWTLGPLFSVISEQFYKWLDHRSNVTLMPCSGSIRGITDQSANVLGLCILNVQLTSNKLDGKRTVFDQPFYVIPNISTECLLGLDFMHKLDAHIQVKSQSLLLGSNKAMHALTTKDFNEKPVPLHVVEKHIVPAHSQMFVACRLNSELADVSWDWQQVRQVTVTPATSMTCQYNLLVPHCVTGLKNDRMVLHVMNNTRREVVLYPNTICGYAEPCDDNHKVFMVTADGHKAEEEDEAVESERHVTFVDEVEVYSDCDDRACKTESSNGYTKPKIACAATSKLNKENIKQWIKNSGLDCDITAFSASEQNQVLEMLFVLVVLDIGFAANEKPRLTECTNLT
jgi:hypothetical protein